LDLENRERMASAGRDKKTAARGVARSWLLGGDDQPASRSATVETAARLAPERARSLKARPKNRLWARAGNTRVEVEPSIRGPEASCHKFPTATCIKRGSTFRGSHPDRHPERRVALPPRSTGRRELRAEFVPRVAVENRARRRLGEGGWAKIGRSTMPCQTTRGPSNGYAGAEDEGRGGRV
jgi:hypothetical protein